MRLLLLCCLYLAATRGGAIAESPGIETSSAQALYTLPRDHATHGGEFYSRPTYLEWMYFTGFFKDLDTGEELSIFVSHFWSRLLGESPSAFSIFSSSTLDKPDHLSKIQFYSAPFTATGSGPDAAPFTYEHGAEEEKLGFRTAYSSQNESWAWRVFQEGVFEVDLAGNTYSPGYIPGTPVGVEQQGLAFGSEEPAGANSSGSGYTWNPSTAAGLSYYYFAPNVLLEGTLSTLGGANRSVQGVAWMEHQWGNYQLGANAFRYIWGYARLDNGDLLTLRQWCRASFDCDPRMNRFAYLTDQGDGGYSVEYALGPSATYTPTGFHEGFPVNGTLETPQGTWHVAPDFPDQTSPGPSGEPFWEGVVFLHAEGPGGPRVGRGFFELVDFSDSGQPPTELDSIALSVTGGLPPLPRLP